MKTDAILKESCNESTAMITTVSSQRCTEVSSRKKHRRRKRQKTGHCVTKSNVNVNGSGVPSNTLESCNESTAMTTTASSQKSTEVSSRKKYRRRKRKKTGQSVIKSNVNGSGVPSDTFSTETSILAFDMPAHPIEYLSMDPVTRQSCAGSCFSHTKKKVKKKNKKKKASESSNAKHDLQGVNQIPFSVVTNTEQFEKECVAEVVKSNPVKVISDKCSNPGDKNGYVKNTSLMKKCDEPVVCHATQEFQKLKTYTRKKRVNTSSRRNSNYSSSVHYKKELIVEDDHKDDFHKFCDGPLTVDLMEKKTDISRDQVTSNGGAASKEMKLMTENTYEQRFVAYLSVVDVPEVQLEAKTGKELDDIQVRRHNTSSAGDIADSSLISKKDDHSKISHFSLGRTITSHSKKKLLVLDVNGLLADIVRRVAANYKPDKRISKKSVAFKRPFCEDFLQFCLDKFHVGVWSSRLKKNVDTVIKFLMGDSASKLLFCWDQSQCTRTEFTTVEKRHKPLVLKELRKLWEKVEPGLPWEKGEFNESNTLLLDDSPYKALLNPSNTAIFPYPYQYKDTGDRSLGLGGDLRVYLEGLAMAENVQEYVASHPFGQPAITESNRFWRYYCKVISQLNASKQCGKPSPGRE